MSILDGDWSADRPTGPGAQVHAWGQLAALVADAGSVVAAAHRMYRARSTVQAWYRRTNPIPPDAQRWLATHPPTGATP